jgi:beta-glucanase (GH16 family)
LPQGVGFWPALWMLGTNISTISWPGCGEIDVVENNGTYPLMEQGSIHSGSDATAIYNFIDGSSVTNFHVYTLDWTTNAILFYVDGHLYETQTSWGSSTANAYPFPFNQPFFLLMNMAIGGNYLGNPSTATINAGTTFPGEMVVDYVRIYTVTDPFRIGIKQTGPNLLLTWPSNVVCHLQAQTNTLAYGLGGNWFAVDTATNQMQITPTGASAFYRLVMP